MFHTYNEEDIQTNRDEIIDVVYSMLDPSANERYHLYPLYKDSFQRFAYDVIETSKITQYQTPPFPEPVYIEEDKRLFISKKQKTKTIVDLFQQVQKI